MPTVEQWPEELQRAWTAYKQDKPWKAQLTPGDIPDKAESAETREFLKEARTWAKSAAALHYVRGDLRTATELKYRRLKGVTTLEPLLIAQNLESLSFDGGTLPSLEPLTHLPKLRRLRITSRTKVKSLDPIKDMEGIRDLVLGKCVQQLDGMQLFLDRLRVVWNGLTDLSPIENCNVLHLQLGSVTRPQYVNVGDDAKLPFCPGLKRLDIRTRAMTHLKPVSGMTKCRALYAARNKKLKSLEGIEELPLEALAVSSTSISDLTPLAGKPLRYLALHRTKVKDITPLLSCENLQMVTLYETPVADDLEQIKALEEHVSGRVYTDWQDAPQPSSMMSSVYGENY